MWQVDRVGDVVVFECSGRENTYRHYVPASKNQRYGFILNVGRQQPPLILSRSHELGQQPEIFEASRHCFRRLGETEK